MTLSNDPAPVGWKARLTFACRNASSEGESLVLAILGVTPRRCPAFADNAVITEDGIVYTGFKKRDGSLLGCTPIGSVVWVRDEVRRIADREKLDDADRKALFIEFHKWFVVDMRAAGKANLQ